MSKSNPSAFWLFEIWNPTIAVRSSFPSKTREYPIPEGSDLLELTKSEVIQRKCIPSLKVSSGDEANKCLGIVDFDYTLIGLPKNTPGLHIVTS